MRFVATAGSCCGPKNCTASRPEGQAVYWVTATVPRPRHGSNCLINAFLSKGQISKMIIKAGDAFFCNLVLMDELQLIYAIKFFAVVFWSAAGYSKILQMKKP